MLARVGADEARRLSTLVGLSEIPGKGRGVVARVDIPAWTFVGTYPGQRMTEAEYDAAVASGAADPTYAVDFWKPHPRTGRPRGGYLLVPRPAHLRGAVVPFVNEPTDGPPSLVWAWNLPRYRLEMWTRVGVPAGQELTVCYGNAGDYPREYSTTCACASGGMADVEPELHVVTRPGRAPVPYSSLGDAGVAAATRALSAG